MVLMIKRSWLLSLLNNMTVVLNRDINDHDEDNDDDDDDNDGDIDDNDGDED